MIGLFCLVAAAQAVSGRPPGFWVGYFGTHISHLQTPKNVVRAYPIFTSDARVQVRGSDSIVHLDGGWFRWFEGKDKIELRLQEVQLAGWDNTCPVVVGNRGAYKITRRGNRSQLATHFSKPTFVVWQPGFHLEFVATTTASTFYCDYGRGARTFSCQGELMDVEVLEDGHVFIDTDRSMRLLNSNSLVEIKLPKDAQPGCILDENDNLYVESASAPDKTGWSGYTTLMRFEEPGKFKQVVRLKGAYDICEISKKAGVAYGLHCKRGHFGEPFVRIDLATGAETVLTDWVDDILPDKYLAVWQNAGYDVMAVSSPRGSRR